MSKLALVIAPAAKEDLKDIYLYGLKHWGRSRSDSYLETLKQQLVTLTEQPLIGVERQDLLPNVRSLPIESHTLFYRASSDAVEIVRVLHGRQDPQLHLA